MTCAERLWRILERPQRPRELVAQLEDEYTQAAIYKALRQLRAAGSIQKRSKVYVRTGRFIPKRWGPPTPQAPKGFVSVVDLARRLHLSPAAMRYRLHHGWAVSWVKVDGHFFIEDRQSYPPTPGGWLQAAIYADLDRPKTVKALAHGRRYESVRGALYALRARGLVQQVSYGMWGRV